MTVAKMYAMKHGYEVYPASELKALGVTNAVGVSVCVCVCGRMGGEGGCRLIRRSRLISDWTTAITGTGHRRNSNIDDCQK